jgi:hypothetical protein
MKMISELEFNNVIPFTQNKMLLQEEDSQNLIELKPLHMSDHELHELICTVAYLKSEGNGFVPGNELDDWLQAEKIVKNYID